MKSAFFLLVYFFAGSLFAQTISIETKTGKSGSAYTFFKKNTCSITFTDKRPDKSDPSIVLAIPAAFTNTGNDHIDGVYAVNGVLGNTNQVNTTLGGVFYIEKNSCRIFQSKKGRLFKDSLYTIIKAGKLLCFNRSSASRMGRHPVLLIKRSFNAAVLLF